MNLDKLRGLYVITDDLLTPNATLLEQVTESLKGGAKIVQLRDKVSSLDEIKQKAIELESLCQEYDAIFVLNDKVELAIELGLSALHIGKSDHHRVKEIRKNFSGYLGVSCYGDISLAKSMQEVGVDYVAFGSFYTSPTKPNANIVDLNILSKARAELNIPVCAIGGISKDNIDEVMEHKPDMISLVSDIWKCEDIKEKSKFYTKFYEE
ncbi:thiamine phosphate synthase [Sulfurimonas aquatica]|uniref:Thiamine-phosphate synthase n=1 Tax=Sulfurimonas aquatica TaxID=2672570 RepID=A0A975B125_9BACT|nr:thiamine phosphate synthase [Sulfurimonas aquatica]QSZ42165.1 thiamine phosphate synthase [Sulfurimonas aquatica]